MYCPFCGKENRDGAKFCGGCGAVLNKEEYPVNSGEGKTEVSNSLKVPKEKFEKSAGIGEPKKNLSLIMIIIIQAVLLVVTAVVLLTVIIRYVKPIGDEDSQIVEDEVETEEETFTIEAEEEGTDADDDEDSAEAFTEGKREAETEIEIYTTKDDYGGEFAVTPVTLETTEIFNNGEVLITADSICIDDWCVSINLTAENYTDSDFTIMSTYVEVNGIALDFSTLFFEVCAGENSCDSLDLYIFELELAGIDTVAEISFTLELFGSDTYDTLDTSDPITLVTSAGSNYEQSIEAGELICDEDGVRVYFSEITEDLYFEGIYIVFYVENSSETEIAIFGTDPELNGEETYDIFGCNIPAGKWGIVYFIFSADELGVYSVEDVNQVAFQLSIYDVENYVTLYDDRIDLIFDWSTA